MQSVSFHVLLVLLSLQASLSIHQSLGVASNHNDTSCQLILAPKYEYTYTRSFPVEGRQGVAIDKTGTIYVSGSKALYKYSNDGELLSKNTNPFESYKLRANHIGDIDFHKGEVFVGAEWFEDGKASNLQIAIHSAKTLKFKRSFSFAPASGQTEVAAIAVNPDTKTVWMCSWENGHSGSHLYQYTLEGQYVGKLEMSGDVPMQKQGINYHHGFLWVTSDDGDAEKNEPDNLYRVAIHGADAGKSVKEKAFTEFKHAGEIEGLVWNGDNELIVHNNYGHRITDGMPGSTHDWHVFEAGTLEEIHELYFYSVLPASS